MLSDNPNVSLKIVKCSLLTRRHFVAERNHQNLQWNLEKQSNGNYSKNFYHFISSKTVYPKKSLNKAPIRKIAVAMITNSAVSESFHENLFNYQQFHLRELRVTRGGRAILSLDTIYPCHPYVTTMKAVQFNQDFPVLLCFRVDFTTGCS